MLYELPAVCPVCKGRFHVKRLGCEQCGSVLEGAFKQDSLSGLPPEMRQFIVVFIKSRGNIREMEKYFGISYPTVRARLDEIIAMLDEFGGDDGGINTDGSDDVNVDEDRNDPDLAASGDDTTGVRAPTRLEVLQMLARGELEIDKAKNLIGTEMEDN